MFTTTPGSRQRSTILFTILPICAFAFLTSTQSTCSMSRLDYLKKTPLYRTAVQHPALTALTMAIGSYCLCKASICAFKESKPLLMRTRVGFHVSRFYNKVRYGTDFTFNRMAGDPQPSNVQEIRPQNNNAFVYYEPQKTGESVIRALNDGKQTPLVLGGIPGKQDDIDQLQKQATKTGGQAKLIGLFTLNENWEYTAAGLHDLVGNNGDKVIQYKYPTPDFDTPSFIDLLRAVRDLENRNHLSIALVHCKAGRGRSATVIGAYLAHVTQKAGQIATCKQIEAYMIARRNQVSLNEKQQKTLTNFISQLTTAKSFETLCEQYKGEMEKRDKEVNELIRRQGLAPAVAKA